MNPRDQFFSNVQKFLEYKKEEGFQTLELSVETRMLLQPDRKAAPAPQRPAPARAAKPRLAFSVSESKQGGGAAVAGQTLEEIAAQVAVCTACPLCKTRKKTVPGEGHPNGPDILFIGEGPGADEDEQGRPFVGAAGKLLDKMIAAMGYKREEVFIANVVKCRPPGNRVPLPEEMAACIPYLKAQIALIRPKIIVALGKTAVEGLLNKPVTITRFRGTWCTYEGIALLPTYHPAYLLRSPGRKGEAWSDLKAVLAKLDKVPPGKK
ncbi:MAG: uracil-DNA glycosylase [Verrucomicrobiota bacterium]|jgi:DNA polymerase|nr:uracil-DNA glycosylase [Verrucomicrobiota bacterium]MDK2963633.1 uracil-DNA glycosylase [Verrucomicrobiota bacterium]